MLSNPVVEAEEREKQLKKELEGLSGEVTEFEGVFSELLSNPVTKAMASTVLQSHGVKNVENKR